MTIFTRFFTLLCLFLSLLSTSWADEDFLEPNQAFQFTASVSAENQLNLHFDIASQYYMYKERFELKVMGDDAQQTKTQALLKNLHIPTGELKFDPTFNKELEVYHHNVDLRLTLPKSDFSFTLELTAQGCADAGLCYPPQYYYLPLSPTANGYEIGLSKNSMGEVMLKGVDEPISEDVNSTAPIDQTNLLDAGDTQIAAWLGQASLLSMLAIAFLLGLTLSFTPCVLPMLPILLSLIVGKQAQSQGSRWFGLRLTLMYVLGTSIVYTLLGVLAASLGAALANWIQNPWVLSSFALVLVLFGIAMMSAYNLQMPSSVQSRLTNLVNRLPAGQMGSALIMGMLSALIVGPCVAAPLAGILLFISQTGNLLLGAVVLFVLAWGQGASLLLLGSSSGALLPRAGEWMNTVKHICGLLLMAAALWMVSPLLPSWLPMLLWAALALAFAFVVRTFSFNKPRPSLGGVLLRGIGIVAFCWAVLLMIGVVMGSRSVLSPLSVSSSANSATVQFQRITSITQLKQVLSQADKPVMLDFYADWCIACREMEHFTFTDPQVKDLLDQMLLLQVDVTKNTVQDRALLKQFQLFGPPGIIFFDAQGQIQPQVRVIGFQSAEKFRANLRRVLGDSQ